MKTGVELPLFDAFLLFDRSSGRVSLSEETMKTGWQKSAELHRFLATEFHGFTLAFVIYIWWKDI